MPTVFIPSSLHRHTGQIKQLKMSAKTVREVVDQLDAQFPGLRERLCDGGRLKPGISVAIGSRISELGLLERVDAGDEVHFVSSVGGG